MLDWTEFQMRYGPALKEGVADCPCTEVFAKDKEMGAEHWQDLRKRVIEHVSIYVYRENIIITTNTIMAYNIHISPA